MTKPKIMIWDLETTNLKGNMGHILTAAACWAGEDECFSWNINRVPGYGMTPASYIDDSSIVRDLIDMMNESDATVAHYGQRFDLRFLHTRALVHGIDVPAPVKLIDTWRYARDKLALTSNRLETLASFLNSEHQKYKLPLEAWTLAQHGDPDILREMEEYCINDVLTLEEVYLKLRPLIHDHPYSVEGDRTSCPACGSKKVQRRGYRRTKAFKIERWNCTECGSWYSGKQQKVR